MQANFATFAFWLSRERLESTSFKSVFNALHIGNHP